MEYYIGVDIGRRFVKVAMVEHKNRFSMSEVFMFSTPYSNKSSARTIEPKDFFDKILNKIPSKILRNASVAINIPSSLITMMVVSMPKMSRKEIEVAAVSEAKRKMLPTPGPKSVFENLILREVVVGKIPRLEVMVVKTEKEYVDEFLNLFVANADIAPVMIVPTCFTVINHFAQEGEIHKKDVAFVDVGYESIDISIAQKGKSHFYRNIKFGLKDIIGHISAALNITPEETEKVIIEKGIPQVEIDLNDKVKVAEEIMRQKYEMSVSGKTVSDVNPLELRMLWSTEIERVIHEIRRTLIYYKEQTSGGRVETIFFLGGGSKIKGILPLLQNDLGGICEVITPFKGLDISVAPEEKQAAVDNDSIFTSALSLALNIPLVKRHKEIIDFLPVELKKRREIAQKQVSLFITGLLAAFLLFLGVLNVFVSNHIANLNKQSLEKVMDKSKDVRAKLDELNTKKNSLQQKTSSVTDFEVTKRDATIEFLSALAVVVPDEVVLTAVSVNQKPAAKNAQPGYRISIDAFCVADYQHADSLAHDFKTKLAANPLFSNVASSPVILETIVPVIDSQDAVTLTELKERTMHLEADLVVPKNEKS